MDTTKSLYKVAEEMDDGDNEAAVETARNAWKEYLSKRVALTCRAEDDYWEDLLDEDELELDDLKYWIALDKIRRTSDRESALEKADSKADAMRKALKEADYTEMSDDEGVIESGKPSFRDFFKTDSIEFKKEDGEWKVCNEMVATYSDFIDK